MRPHYRDLRVPISLLGFPGLQWLGGTRLVVSDWTHRMLTIDEESGELLSLADLIPEGGLPLAGTLSSLCGVPGPIPRCAVATRTQEAYVWNPDEGSFKHVIPHGGGPVNCVFLSHTGTDLLLGTGFYPLSPTVSEAAVERWILDPDPRFHSRQKLVGTAVDRLDWDANSGIIVAHTGARTQDRGYLVLLDERDLRIVEIVETEFAMIRSLRLTPDAERITLVHRSGIEVRAPERLTSPDLEIPVDTIRLQAAIDPSGEHVLLSDGSFYSLPTDAVISLPSPPGLAATAFGPPGAAYGISADGVLRKWDVNAAGL